MEYQKIIDAMQSKFRTRTWLGINDASRRTYKDTNQIKKKTSMIRWNLPEYSDAYILVRGTITVTGAENDDAATWEDETNKGVIFQDCAPFFDFINEIKVK